MSNRKAEKTSVFKSIKNELFSPVLTPCLKCKENGTSTCPPAAGIVDLFKVKYAIIAYCIEYI